MADINKVVQVNITRQTAATTRKGFGTLLFYGPHQIFSERTKKYTTTQDMLNDGFLTTDPIYIGALSFFGQNPNQNELLVGRIQVDTAGVSIDTVVDSTDYSLVINGVTVTHTSGVGDSTADIAAGLVNEINTSVDPLVNVVTAVDDLDGTFVINIDTAGDAWTLTAVGTNLSVEKPLVGAETLVNAYTAIKNETTDFYAVDSTIRTQAEVEALAAQILTENRILGTASSDATILTASQTDTTSIAATLNALNNERTFVLYTSDAANFPDVAWLSGQLSTDPGSSTWAYEKLANEDVDALNETQSDNVHAKNANTYETVGDNDVTLFGTMASGEYIDIIRGIDWLSARIGERVFGLLVNNPKVPHTDPGYASVEAEIRAQLQDGIAQGLIAADPAPTVTVPLAANVSQADKAARLLKDVSFTAVLQGAVHNVTINGIVTL